MKVSQIWIAGVVLFALLGCSALVTDEAIDYRAGGAQIPKLEVPPDLTTPGTDERYKVPGDGAAPSAVEGVATYSDYNKGGAAQGRGASVVLPEVPGVRLERDGARRWLVVSDNPDKVWSIVEAFWQETGLTIMSEEQAAGVLETDWAENRAKIPKSAIRNVLGKVFDRLYSSGERDQYLTRLEHSKDGVSTEVYITHRGIKQVFSEDKTSSEWRVRANDPEMEAIMLQRLMVRFGASEVQASSAVIQAEVPVASSVPASSTSEPAGTSSLREVSGGDLVIVVNDTFDRVWRRTGLAIESAGLGLEDKDRDMGTYFLRPIKVQSSWLDKLKFWKKSEYAEKSYRVYVKDGGAVCEVSVTDQHGASSKVTKQLTESIYKDINQ
ncbi:MAG: outer membrane protein assembly factor BamC [Gallionella sp.]